jgi:hypothetical protein
MQNLGNISGINAFQPVDNNEDRLSGAAGVDAAGLAQSGPEAEQKEANKGWILNPILDYLFVCGGLMWMLYGATMLGVDAAGSNANSRLYGSILYWGALILADSHGPASMVRVFGSKTTPNRVRYIVVFWALILVGVSCFSLGNRPLAQAFVTITRLWAVQHYIAQTFGIVLIYCLKRDYKLDPFERFVFQGLMRTMMWFIFIRFFTFPEYGHVENFMGLDLPFYGPLPSIYVFSSQFVFTFFVLLFSVCVILHLIFKKQFFPLPALIAIFSVAAVTLSPRNGFYLLGVTFLHSSQYIAITLAYFLREKSFVRTGHVPRNILPKLVSWWTVGWFGVIVTLGYIGSIALPEFGIKIGLPDALVLCTVYALLSCHHFLTDAFIWRIRDPQVRRLLV